MGCNLSSTGPDDGGLCGMPSRETGGPCAACHAKRQRQTARVARSLAPFSDVFGSAFFFIHRPISPAQSVFMSEFFFFSFFFSSFFQLGIRD